MATAGFGLAGCTRVSIGRGCHPSGSPVGRRTSEVAARGAVAVGGHATEVSVFERLPGGRDPAGDAEKGSNAARRARSARPVRTRDGRSAFPRKPSFSRAAGRRAPVRLRLPSAHSRRVGPVGGGYRGKRPIFLERGSTEPVRRSAGEVWEEATTPFSPALRGLPRINRSRECASPFRPCRSRVVGAIDR